MKGNPTLEELADIDRRYPVPSAEVRAMLARVAPSWTLVKHAGDGAFFVRGTVQVIISLELMDDRRLWIHASACGHTSGRRPLLPSWEEMKRVKHDFIGEDRWAYQVFPPMSEYVNQNPCVLHLFAPFENYQALPDFTRGLGVL